MFPKSGPPPSSPLNSHSCHHTRFAIQTSIFSFAFLIFTHFPILCSIPSRLFFSSTEKKIISLFSFFPFSSFFFLFGD